MEFKLESFFFDTPIYTYVDIGENDMNEFKALFFSTYDKNVEGYNPWRKVNSTFYISRRLTYNDNSFLKNGGFGTIHLDCKRYHDEFRFFVYWEPEKKFIIKIGQYPTVADFHIGEIKHYKKVIANEKLKEFTRAVGLAANGVGIGSFVYLGRIFEHLIQEAYTEAKGNDEITEAEFLQARMEDKIDLLSAYLPTFLVENNGMYSILSLGIHDLDEQTCLNHFDTVKVGIEIILDEKLDELRKKEKIDDAKKKLAKARGEIKNPTAN